MLIFQNENVNALYPRGLTLSEISYTLAEITEIKIWNDINIVLKSKITNRLNFCVLDPSTIPDPFWRGAYLKLISAILRKMVWFMRLRNHIIASAFRYTKIHYLINMFLNLKLDVHCMVIGFLKYVVLVFLMPVCVCIW